MMGVTPKFLQFLLILGGYVVGFAVIGVHLFMDVYDDNGTNYNYITASVVHVLQK